MRDLRYVLAILLLTVFVGGVFWYISEMNKADYRDEKPCRDAGGIPVYSNYHLECAARLK